MCHISLQCLSSGPWDFYGPRGCWGLEKHVKTRINRTNENSSGSETHKNTCVFVCFGPKHLWPRKRSQTQKHVKTRVFSLGHLFRLFGPCGKHTKTRQIRHLGTTYAKTRVFTCFVQMCLIVRVFVCFLQVPKPKPRKNTCF